VWLRTCLVVPLAVLAACERSAPPRAGAPPQVAVPLARGLPALRAQLNTVYFSEAITEPAPAPPPGLFELVRYRAPLGENVAYVSPARAGARRPAVLWVSGGHAWGLGDHVFKRGQREDDQSAFGFIEAGIVVMHAALRGQNGNPGRPECFLGEVDDLLAAADYLATRPDVDPARIYLAGHSSGGTLALLTAQSTGRFRAVFAFGPIHDVRAYDACLPMDAAEGEWQARAPYLLMREITSPTYVIEGSGGAADVMPLLRTMAGAAPVAFIEVTGADHFTVLAPGVDVVAGAIMADTGPAAAIRIDAESIAVGLAP
jgi:pimeloyl-ACP methyl ester carboxylesterase